MTRGVGWTLSSFPGTQGSVSRNQCKCHGLSRTLWWNVETKLGMGRCVQAAGKMPAPNFSDEQCEHRGLTASTLARPSSTPEASGASPEKVKQGVSRKTQGT